MARKFLTNIDLSNNKIVNSADPSGPLDVANRQYVDNLALGAAHKKFVDVATTTNAALTTAYANGSSIDGTTLTTGMRVLIKNQTTASTNGIYTVNASGSPTRATDADETADFASGLMVGVRRGTVNGDSVWLLANDTAPVLGTDALSFIQVNGGSSTYIAGDGLTESPVGTFHVNPGEGVEVVTDAVRVKLNGVSLTRSASGLSVTSPNLSFAASIGNGSATSIAVTHNLGTRDVVVDLYHNTTYESVDADVVRTDVNTVTVSFVSAPASNAYRVVISG